MLLELVHRLWSSSNRHRGSQRGFRFSESSASTGFLEQAPRSAAREQNDDVEIARPESVEHTAFGVPELDRDLGKCRRGPRDSLLTANQSIQLNAPPRLEMCDDSI